MSDTPDVSIPAFKQYLSGVKSEATALKYSKYTTTFLQMMAANGYKKFSEIPPGLLSTFASMLSQQGKNPSTVRVQVFAVKKYLEWVAGRGMQVPPQNKPELPKRNHVIKESLPQAQFSLYFRQADMELEEPVRTAAMLLPCSGLRADEMVHLKLSSIKQYSVQLKNKKIKKTMALLVFGKGGKERVVPLMEEGVEILTGYLAGWRSRQPGPWLFPRTSQSKGERGRLKAKSTGKKAITDRSLRSALQKLREPLGMEFTPHTMRRTYITMLWRKGVNLATIAKIAGHASVQTTINHYIVMDNKDNIQALHDAGSALTE